MCVTRYFRELIHVRREVIFYESINVSRIFAELMRIYPNIILIPKNENDEVRTLLKLRIWIDR